MFKRILIANRGEIALRVMRAAKAMGIESVAIYSEADVEAPHRVEADVAVCVGGPKSADSYLNIEAILQAAEQTEAKAIHPGYGFLSENALFSELCAQHKITFIGPGPRVIRLMGDKATARRTMQAAGLPVIPGSEGVLAGLDEATEVASDMGFPVLLKATAGGGGKGMRICRDLGALGVSFAQAAMEADKAFGNPGLYMEKYIERGRHIEFQFMADSFGNAVHLGERECSAQRNHQKLIEESPSAVMTAELRAELGDKVRKAVAAIGYVGAGTMEFLRDPSGKLYFMEVNTRLQVEHPVTEMVTGFDLVQEQIRVAANHRLSMRQEDVRLQGHAIEVRVNAEDPFDGFKPCPGLVSRFEPPAAADGVRVRVDTYVRDGTRIPVYYDSMICKLIVAAETRDQARRGMIEALGKFRVEGIKTTIPLHLKILASEAFASGTYDTGLVGGLLAQERPAGN
ncbi:MAG: acetyl-CoA carboxylase biotin carboxylase subunit [Deltaproteobacteria bacterium]|nr:acetyl-CoA carboxylase biotin carboxylase subunit [Deltaproteobacteria bacterium]